jgi:RNA 2',3'-cyclic 3'-phosphodiesterase
MRLFTAFWLEDAAVEALREVADPDEPPAGWRAVDPGSWHITLAFHGEADPGVLARRLDRAVRGRLGPRLRTAGAGVFDGVRWAGVEAEPGERLGELVEVAGGRPDRFVPHVTLLRRRARPGAGADLDPPDPWADHRGPWWSPPEVLLVSSEPGRSGSRYRVVHRVPLHGG